MKLVHVLVIDDSAFMRKMITEILSSDSRIEVIGTAQNGEIGLQKIASMRPDVVTLDVEMPVMDGLKTLSEIMKTMPTPVVMLSSATAKGAHETLEAIALGAFDFITKPSGSISLDINKLQAEIVEKVIAAKYTQDTPVEKQKKMDIVGPKRPAFSHHKTIITIGTSTGGPRALQAVLSAIPKNKIPPIVIVQHMPAKFTKSLADRLDQLVEINVREAVHGDILRENTAYIAPGGYHMKVRSVTTMQVIELSKEEPKHGHRPSVDILFESLSDIKDSNKMAIVLTGMGKDGSEGCKVIKEKDPHSFIVAESSESAIINGMPKAVVETGTANLVLQLTEIGSFIGTLSKK